MVTDIAAADPSGSALPGVAPIAIACIGTRVRAWIRGGACVGVRFGSAWCDFGAVSAIEVPAGAVAMVYKGSLKVCMVPSWPVLMVVARMLEAAARATKNRRYIVPSLIGAADIRPLTL